MQEEIEVEYAPKPIPCILSGGSGSQEQLSLIFTHGAGGGLTADATANFCAGFSTVAPVLAFHGNSNVKSRTKMFTAVMADRGFSTCLGGRSMGSRAAVIAASSETESLILVSYPLQGPNDVRDQILLDLPAKINVLFIIGDGDSMCDLDQLDDVRKKMKSATWRIAVKSANHGMTVKPKGGTETVGKKTGEIAAKWLLEDKPKLQEGIIQWSVEEGEATWSGWLSTTTSTTITKSNKNRSSIEATTPAQESSLQPRSSKRVKREKLKV